MGTQATTPTSSTGTLASLADRHELYERAVQEPEEEVVFLDELFQALRGRKARSLREDFCGTALLATRWVESAPDRTAIGVDLDAPTLDWAARHRVVDAARRVLPAGLVLLRSRELEVTGAAHPIDEGADHWLTLAAVAQLGI